MFFEGKMCYDLLPNGLHINNMIVFALFPVSMLHFISITGFLFRVLRCACKDGWGMIE
jgi:hypothetical protein